MKLKTFTVTLKMEDTVRLFNLLKKDKERSDSSMAVAIYGPMLSSFSEEDLEEFRRIQNSQ